MATTTRKRRPARKTSATAAKAPAAEKNGTSRARADEATVAARRDAIQKRVVNGNETAATVAKDLGITAGKAAFIAMQLRVESGEVPKIAFKNDDQLVANTVKARDKADEYSSWGWLAARTGVSEPVLKAKVDAAGHSVKGTKIASVRKATRPTPKTATTAKKAAATKSKSTRTRTRRAQADPS